MNHDTDFIPPPSLERQGERVGKSIDKNTLSVFYHTEFATPLFPERSATTEETYLCFVHTDLLVGRCPFSIHAEWRPDACVVLVPLPITVTFPLNEFKTPHKRQFPVETNTLFKRRNYRIMFLRQAKHVLRLANRPTSDVATRQ